jgi:hypothetical protein
MQFINNGKINNFSFFSFATVLLFITSFSFVTFGSASAVSDQNAPESNRFAFLQNNPANFLFGSNMRQNSFTAPLFWQTSQTDEILSSEVFEQFDVWVKAYVGNGYRADDEQVSRGETLALKRRELLKQLIKIDPKAALDKAITAETLKQLPEYIAKHSEKRISATGDFLVYVVEGLNRSNAKSKARFSSSRTERSVVVDETRYKASVYGRRESMTTKLNIPLQGIVIDDVMAVDENPARILDEVGGEQKNFASEAEMDRFIDEQIEWESTIGPVRVSTGNEKSLASESLTPEQTTSMWTQGEKKLLVIRVDFPDKTGAPITTERAVSLYSEVNQFFVNNSYGKTSIKTTVVTDVVRLPEPLTYYVNQFNSTGRFDVMINHARSGAQDKGFNTVNYDFDIVAMTSTPLPGDVIALSDIGSKGSVLTANAFFLLEAAHELGHNYGLEHANLWGTTDGTPDGPGESEEYNDCFDMMGACGNQNSHFNAIYKNKLNWLPNNNVVTVTGGEHTIYPLDVANAGGATRALRINRDGTRNYWIEFRQLFEGNPSVTNGALIRWDTSGDNPAKSQLLDMNAATERLGDAPLAVGQTFHDRTYGISIKVKSKSASELLVEVKTGLPAEGCTYSLSPLNVSITGFNQTNTSTNVITGPNCPWTATSNNVNWLTVTGGSSGTGNGTVSISAAHNSGEQRDGTVTVGGQTFTVTQFTGSCVSSIKPTSFIDSTDSTSFNVPASGGNLSYAHSCNSVTPISAGTSEWIIINNGSITVLENTGAARSGSLALQVADTNGGNSTKILNVRQAGQGASCTFSLNSTSRDFTASAGTGVLSVSSTNAGCSTTYSAVSSASWITISNPSGQAGSNINYTVAQNTSGASRIGTITVSIPNAGSRTFTVNQAAAAACTFSTNPSSRSFSSATGAGNFTLTASDPNCSWSAATSDSWVNITGSTSGTGSAQINFTVSSNNGAARTANITVGGQVFNVTQESGCTFSLSSPNSNFGESGGNGSVIVNSGAGCAWNAATNSSSWISFTSNTNGNGNGTVNFAVAANTGQARTGTITVGNQSITIAQAAMAVVPNVSIANISLSEGNSGTTTFAFTVNLSSAASQAVSVNYATANGTAVAGEDYTAASGILTFAAGETSKLIAVSVNGDAVIEPDEAFTVNLSNAVNASISAGAGTGTIQNDDAGGSLQFSLSNYTANENAGTATVTVTRTGGAASGVSVNYSTSNGSAIAGQDYSAASGTLNFGANETSKTFTVPITNDSISEPNETINLTLSNSVGGTLGTPATAVLTIIDDDGAPTLSIGNVSANEGNSGTTAFNFTVSLLGASSQTVTVNYSTANGTATAPSDFQSTSNSLSFAPGDTVKNITVLVNGDTEVEANETFTVNLSGAVNATIANGIGTGTIQNDDVACTYSIAPTFLNTNADAKSGNTIFVTTQAGCSWTTTTVDSFITINSGASGSGNGTVSFSVSTNSGAARTGTILVAGQTFTVNQTAATIAPRKVLFDFDGDGRSDVSVFRPDNGVWYQLNSTSGFFSAQFGILTDKIAPADFDGDGKTDIAVFRDGNWFLQRSRDGFASIPFGSPGDIPEPADFDGDGRAELVVFRPSNGVWYSLNLVGNAFSAVQFGAAEDNPVAADYDGDGKADQAVYRPSNGVWYMLKSRDGFSAVQFGIATDKPAVGDFDGDGRADQAVYRAESGIWYILGSTKGFTSMPFGLPTDIPAPGDYDGDGKTDIAVFRPENGMWYQMKSVQGFGAVQFGAKGDKPIPNSLVR